MDPIIILGLTLIWGQLIIAAQLHNLGALGGSILLQWSQ